MPMFCWQVAEEIQKSRGIETIRDLLGYLSRKSTYQTFNSLFAGEFATWMWSEARGSNPSVSSITKGDYWPLTLRIRGRKIHTLSLQFIRQIEQGYIFLEKKSNSWIFFLEMEILALFFISIYTQNSLKFRINYH